jgi:two-component system autoinducer 2 sensor kinase/phosphatase LuxQ
LSYQGTVIAPEEHTGIYMPFFRHYCKTIGSGLGLRLVGSLLDSCGGDVSIRSEKGKGTTVLVTLPLSNADRWAGVVRP